MSRRTRQERNTQRLALRIAQMSVEPCILCGGPPAAVGLWTPTPEYQDRLGRPPGKTRLAVYSLCRSCTQIPNPSALIEDRIIADHDRTKYAADRN